MEILASIYHTISRELRTPSESHCPPRFSAFVFQKLRNVSLGDYLEHVQTHSKLDDEVFILGYFYVTKLLSFNEDLSLSALTVHMIFLTGVHIAQKAICDEYIVTERMARIGGLRYCRIVEMEKLFIDSIHWDLGTSGFLEFRESLTRIQIPLTEAPIEKQESSTEDDLSPGENEEVSELSAFFDI